jgi:hypothetical protein
MKTYKKLTSDFEQGYYLPPALQNLPLIVTFDKILINGIDFLKLTFLRI